MRFYPNFYSQAKSLLTTSNLKTRLWNTYNSFIKSICICKEHFCLSALDWHGGKSYWWNIYALLNTCFGAFRKNRWKYKIWTFLFWKSQHCRLLVEKIELHVAFAIAMPCALSIWPILLLLCTLTKTNIYCTALGRIQTNRLIRFAFSNFGKGRWSNDTPERFSSIYCSRSCEKWALCYWRFANASFCAHSTFPNSLEA